MVSSLVYQVDAVPTQKRERFSNRLAFYFITIGSAVGFGNVWRFPALAFRHGGGAFFIPYLLALFLIGIPMLFLEIALGQYYQRGDVSVFASFHRRLRGVGISSVVSAFILLTYYSMLIAWSFRALVESGSESAPWGSNVDVPVQEGVNYFKSEIVGARTVGENMRPTRIVWENVGYSAAIFAIIFISTAFSLKNIGRIAYFTMGIPVILIFIFLGVANGLDGSDDGVDLYIRNWDVKRLGSGMAWSEAVGQIFFSLSLTSGIMTSFGSHMPRSEPAFMNSIVIAMINSLFSFVAGFAVFAALGHQAHLLGVSTDSLRTEIEGFSLVFGTWPTTFSSLPGGIHLVRLLFLNLVLLGIDSAFGLMEALTTCIRDVGDYQSIARWKVVGAGCFICWLFSLIYATDAGLNFLDVVDYYINFTFITVGFFESFSVGWIYGFDEVLELFGPSILYTYMFTSFGATLFGCAFWFGLENHAVWAGFVAYSLFHLVGLCVVFYLLKVRDQEENRRRSLLVSFSDLAFGNMRSFKQKFQPIIGTVPMGWCFLIKHIVPHVLLVFIINLAVSVNDEGKGNFGNYGSYRAWPYQTLGILSFLFAAMIVIIGCFAPDLYSKLDTHKKDGDPDETEVTRASAFPLEPLERISDVDEIDA